MTTPSTPTSPDGERRRNPRVTVPWPAIVHDAHGQIGTGEVIDVSLSGMKLRAATLAPVGDAVRLRVTLPHGAGEVEMSARIVRRDGEGIAVDFGRLPAEVGPAPAGGARGDRAARAHRGAGPCRRRTHPGSLGGGRARDHARAPHPG